MTDDDSAGLDGVLIGGREPVAITIADYDEAWPVRFRETAARIDGALGARALDVEHIGSTSVPGLAAKAIIDVLLTVESVTDEESYVPPLVATGFVLRVREAGHRMLRTPARDVHVHVYEPHRPEVQDYRDLRDWLRADAPDRALYASTKRHLAERQYGDMNEYAEAKSEVVREILERARAWRTGDVSAR